MDVSKAFDKLWHGGLLCKLTKSPINPHLRSAFPASEFNSRTFSMNVDGMEIYEHVSLFSFLQVRRSHIPHPVNSIALITHFFWIEHVRRCSTTPCRCFYFIFFEFHQLSSILSLSVLPDLSSGSIQHKPGDPVLYQIEVARCRYDGRDPPHTNDGLFITRLRGQRDVEPLTDVAACGGPVKIRS